MARLPKASKPELNQLSTRELELCVELLDVLAERIACRVAARLRDRTVATTIVSPQRASGAAETPSSEHLVRAGALYRVSDVAQKLGVSKATVYGLVRRGELELMKIGLRASCVPGESIAAFIARRRGR
ncbi:MAG: DNA-binding protein [Paraburkholderia sp.]|nr:MAG: DNA-binding protein [Paraburkholderia sp.]TAM28045.1 MAG: DNA-binding protein [Paraburkholderia sp.]